MIDKRDALMHYSRSDVQEEMLRHSEGKEISVRFKDSFGKRPDILKYPGDIVEQVKNGATSFHVSVESWSNPMRINTGMKRSELDSIRVGWDLLFDIDIPNLDLSKILAHLIIKSLKDHGIKNVSIKFSGNKGFHIGVPFEVFPSSVTIGPETKETRLYFPEGPIKISEYLMDYIEENYVTIKGDLVRFDSFEFPAKKLEKLFPDKKIIRYKCKKCSDSISSPYEGMKIFCVCRKCGHDENHDYTLEKWNEEYKCKKCDIYMEKNWDWISKCHHDVESEIDLSMILEVDRQIFSSRHMYRMLYSLHEKSGLVSIPFNPDKVMKFEKRYAKPDSFKISKHRFMDRTDAIPGEGKDLITKAKDHIYKDKGTIEVEESKSEYKEFLDFSIKIPQELFPPCIINGLGGVKDGRKRYMFALINFLASCNYPYDEIEKIVLEWNKRNYEELKENIVIGQLKFSKQRKESIMPPNCFYTGDRSTGYYLDLDICKPDNFCPKIKNPFQYSKFKATFINEDKKPAKKTTKA